MKKYPIVILHGWNLSAAKFEPLQSEFEKRGYKVICFDLPGFGKNATLSYPFTIHDYGQYVVDYLKKKKITEAIIVGHSFGGRIGIYMSINFPSMVKALVLSGTPGLGADLTLKEKVYLFLAKIGKIIFAFPPFSMLQDFARKFLYRIIGSYDYYRAKGALRETFQNIVAYRLESLLDKIKAPTLIIWGQEDKIVPVKVAYGMNELIKNSKLSIITQARHGFLWTHSKIFVDEVEKFLKIYESD